MDCDFLIKTEVTCSFFQHITMKNTCLIIANTFICYSVYVFQNRLQFFEHLIYALIVLIIPYTYGTMNHFASEDTEQRS